jgi:RND family efflux transporter MFP subunit
MKRAIIIVLILTVVSGSTFAGYYYLTPAPPPAVSEDPTAEIVEVGLETLVNRVSATGQIEPKAEVDLKFAIGGVVAEALVERGQPVSAGMVLARLKTDRLEYEIRQAEIDLTVQEAELEKLFEPQLAEEIASAQARVASSRLKLADLQAGPNADDITKAEAELKLKQVVLKKAQWDYDEVAYRGDVGAMPQADSLQEATLNYEIAQANYNLAIKDPTTAEIAEAQTAVAEAAAALAKLLKGPGAAEIAGRQAAIDKARLTLQEQRRNLKDAVLVAPTAGLILELNIEPGERVLTEADTPVLVIANTSAYLLKVQVDEIDIGRIRRGQPASMALDAFPDREFQGQVTDISPSPTKNSSGGIVTFEVTITLAAEEDSGLLPGMTATAGIETERLDQVVTVPNRAIQIDRGPDKSTVFVEKLDDSGVPIRVEVELGLRENGLTQITTGLEAGDQIVIRTKPDSAGKPNL